MTEASADALELTAQDIQQSFCVDLLCHEKSEGFVVALLSEPAAEWRSVEALLEQGGTRALFDSLPSLVDVFVMWLEPPIKEDGNYVLILFQLYGVESMWNTVAYYNAARLADARKLANFPFRRR